MSSVVKEQRVDADRGYLRSDRLLSSSAVLLMQTKCVYTCVCACAVRRGVGSKWCKSCGILTRVKGFMDEELSK